MQPVRRKLLHLHVMRLSDTSAAEQHDHVNIFKTMKPSVTQLAAADAGRCRLESSPASPRADFLLDGCKAFKL